MKVLGKYLLYIPLAVNIDLSEDLEASQAVVHGSNLVGLLNSENASRTVYFQKESKIYIKKAMIQGNFPGILPPIDGLAGTINFKGFNLDEPNPTDDLGRLSFVEFNSFQDIDGEFIFKNAHDKWRLFCGDQNSGGADSVLNYRSNNVSDFWKTKSGLMNLILNIETNGLVDSVTGDLI